MKIDENTRCIVSLSKRIIFDFINPETGETQILNRTIEDYKEKYPDVIEMNFDEYCAWYKVYKINDWKKSALLYYK